jgi:hypothetical protein
MLKKFSIFFLLTLFLTGCETTSGSNTAYFEHYERCSQTNERLKDIYACGNASRQSILNQFPGERSQMGDRYEDYIFQLVKAVDNGTIKEDVAKLEFYKVTQAARRDLQNMMIAASIYSQQQQSQSMALMNQGLSMLNGQSSNTFSSGTGSSGGITHMYSHNYTSGTNRICVYKLGNQQKIKTIGVAEMCPMSY